MEWVVTTGRTIEEAKGAALDQLGVAEDDAEFEVLEQPRPGLFGRTRGVAKVRARVRPTQPRPKLDRRDRRKKADARPADDDAAAAQTADVGVDVDADGAAERPARAARAARAPGRSRRVATSSDEQAATPVPAGTATVPTLAGAESEADELASGDAEAGRDRTGSNGAGGSRRGRRGRGAGGAHRDDAVPEQQQEWDDVDAAQVGDEAKKFIEGLVDAFGLDGATSVHRDGDDLEVAVEGADLGLLVGPRGTTLQAIQELTRVAAQRRLGDHDTRLRVDVAGYRVRRREALSRFAAQVAAEVVASGEARALEPMSSPDRKVIHDALSEHPGVSTRSEGDDPARRVVIEPAS